MGQLRRSSLAAIAWAILLPMWASMAQDSERSPSALIGDDAQMRSAWAVKWLRSDNPRFVAWGAWLARVDRQAAAVPLLLQHLAQYVPSERPGARGQEKADRHDAMLEVLDAVLEMRVPVPVKQAQNLYPEFAAQSLILVLRSPEDTQAALLNILDRANTNRAWLAVGNALFRPVTAERAFLPEAGDRAFVERFLGRFTQHLKISIWDPGRGGGESEYRDTCGLSPNGPKPGWPPVGLYDLTQFPERFPASAAILLASGETPVYYWRAESGNYENPPDARVRCDDGDRDEYRAQYLTRLLGYVPLRLVAYPTVQIRWLGGALLQPEPAEIVEKQMADLRSARASLQQLFPPRAPGGAYLPAPHLELVIDDRRQDKSIPLPVPKLDETVEIRTNFSNPLP